MFRETFYCDCCEQIHDVTNVGDNVVREWTCKECITNIVNNELPNERMMCEICQQVKPCNEMISWEKTCKACVNDYD